MLIDIEIVGTDTQFTVEDDFYLGLWYYKGDWGNQNVEYDQNDTSCHLNADAISDDTYFRGAQICNMLSMCIAFIACSYLLLGGCRLIPKSHRQGIACAIIVALIFLGFSFLALEGRACANNTLQEVNPNLNIVSFHAHCIMGKGGVFVIIAMVLWLLGFLSILAIKDDEKAKVHDPDDSSGVDIPADRCL